MVGSKEKPCKVKHKLPGRSGTALKGRGERAGKKVNI